MALCQVSVAERSLMTCLSDITHSEHELGLTGSSTKEVLSQMTGAPDRQAARQGPSFLYYNTSPQPTAPLLTPPSEVPHLCGKTLP